MSIGFYLKYKDRESTPIITKIAFKGLTFRRAVGESIPVRYWNSASQRCKESSEFRVPGRRINKTLNEIFVAATQACDYFVEQRSIPNQSEFWAKTDFFLSGGKVIPDIFFTDYFQEYIDRYRGIRAVSTTNKYITAIRKLKQYESTRKVRLTFEHIDIKFYRDFERFIYSLKREDSDMPYSLNYFGALVKCIMVVYREARDTDGLHNLNGTAHREFKAVQRTADTIYLTVEELIRIHRLQITPELVLQYFPEADKRSQNMARRIAGYNVAKNKFLIGAFTGLRVSDFNRLSEVNIQDDRIRIRTKKTDAHTVIPIHWVIREILDSGFDIATPLSEQKLNEHIKEVCKLAGIDSPIETTHYAGGRRITEVSPKWQLVSNHTARRSGITNMVKAGIPIAAAMKISTHTTVKSFMAYLKISLEENADILAESSFFKQSSEGD